MGRAVGSSLLRTRWSGFAIIELAGRKLLLPLPLLSERPIPGFAAARCAAGGVAGRDGAVGESGLTSTTGRVPVELAGLGSVAMTAASGQPQVVAWQYCDSCEPEYCGREVLA